MIDKIFLVGDNNPEVFMNDMYDMIKDFQSKGYKVEVQYNKSSEEYSALVIARKAT